MRHKRCFRCWDKKNHKWALDSNKMPFYLIGETTMFDLLNQYRIEEFGDLEIEEFLTVCDRDDDRICEGDYVEATKRNGELAILEVSYDEKLCCFKIGDRTFQDARKYGGFILGTKAKLNVKLAGNIHEGVKKCQI